jgi:hypothetical protein
MTVVSAERTEFGLCVVFADGDNKEMKYVRIADTSVPLSSDATLKVLRRIREAQRDFLYKQYGNDWRVHEKQRVAGGFFTADISDEEAELLTDVVEKIGAV